MRTLRWMSCALLFLALGALPASAQPAMRPAPDPQAALKNALTRYLPGDAKTYYSLAVVTTTVERDTSGEVVQGLAVFGELLFSPVTIIGAIAGDRNLRPGMLLNQARRPNPPKQSHEVEVVVLKGKSTVVDALLNHLVTPPDGKIRTWTLVGRTLDRAAAIKTADRAEVNLKRASQPANMIAVTRQVDPAE